MKLSIIIVHTHWVIINTTAAAAVESGLISATMPGEAEGEWREWAGNRLCYQFANANWCCEGKWGWGEVAQIEWQLDWKICLKL